MADLLATTDDLAYLMQMDPGDLNANTATLLLECATAAVQQAAGGQRIVEVADDTCSILSTSDSWLDLPQIPVTAVASVVLDGVTLTLGTDYKVFGNRLWRPQGWQNNLGYWFGWDWYPTWVWPRPGAYPVQEPSLSTVTYTHGYAPGAQDLQLARGLTLSLARGEYTNPTAAQSEHIDDYSITFARMTGALTGAEYQNLRTQLRKAYGRRGGLVRIG